ncbi:hypothetical protein GRI69_01150 [Erythrobacter vulgaris]|uniref:Uncharacterized protein n=1 Tax=Qipengyuania vulgaris TaxID=291985 RepID=A0A844XNP1_9SPHN|nr:hypothetical protein [Qipengyuania vulgaris]MXO46867.1 hypothetical protein [Qipengyuania vulgaris]
MNLTLHARIEIGLAMALLLGSCGGGGVVTRDEVIDIADDAVDGSDLGQRLEALASRVEELEAQTALNATNIETAFTNADSDRETANGNAEILNDFKDNTHDRLDRIEIRLGM